MKFKFEKVSFLEKNHWAKH